MRIVQIRTEKNASEDWYHNGPRAKKRKPFEARETSATLEKAARPLILVLGHDNRPREGPWIFSTGPEFVS